MVPTVETHKIVTNQSRQMSAYYSRLPSIFVIVHTSICAKFNTEIGGKKSVEGPFS